MTNLIKLVTDQINQFEERPSLIKTPTMRPTDSSVRIISPSGRKYFKGQCHRAIYYRIKGIPQTNPPTERMPWIWWLGKAWEDKCQELMKEAGILSMDNPRFVSNKGSYILHGEMDSIGIDKTSSPTEFYIVEFKTTGGYFAKTKLMGSARKYKASPKEENLMQTMIYLDHVGEEVKYAVLFYLIRDDMSMTQFKIRLEKHGDKTYPRVANKDQEIGSGDLWLDYPLEGIYQRYEELADFLKNDIKPPRGYTAIYSEEQANLLLADGELTKKQYDEHCSGVKVKGDWNCIGEGTLIKTRNTWKPIEDIRVGDYVYTKNNKYHKVLYTAIDHKEDLVKIKPYNLDDYVCTKDHEILVSQLHWKQGRQKIEDLIDNLQFKKVKDLNLYADNFLYYSIDNRVEDSYLDDDELFLLANFITEGCYKYHQDGNTYAVIITYNIKEKKTAERFAELANLYGSTSHRMKIYKDYRAEKVHQSLQLHICGVKFVRWLKQFIVGRYSYNKYFKKNIMLLPPSKQNILLQYMIDQDDWRGNVRKSETECYCTTSKILAQQVQEIYLRNQKISGFVRMKASVCDFGYGKEYNRKESYHIKHFISNNSNQSIFMPDNSGLFTRLRKIKESVPSNVYDIGVNNEHNFLTQGGIVHNCSYCSYKDHCYEE